MADPLSAAELFERATAADAAGEADTARGLFEQTLALAPDHVPALVNLGTIHQTQGASEKAEQLYRRALALAPETPIAHHNLAGVLLARGDMDGAIAAWLDTVRLAPNNAFFRFNLAGAFENARRLEEALAQLDAILTHEPMHIPAHMAKVPILFERSRFAEAWRAYAHRHRIYWSQYPEQRRPLPSPLWRGEPLAGKKLLVSYEQGLGEQIMFASLIPRLIAQGARLMIECESRLAPLFARSFPAAQIVPWRQPWNPATKAPDIDFHAPVGDLGQWLQAECDQPPPAAGHLKADAEKTRALRAKYETLAQGRKIVGISWSSTAKQFADFKSLPVAALKPFTDDPASFCVSLQYGPAAKEAGPLYVDWAIDPMADIDAAAAQIAATDTVVTISNTVAHLAGALGKPILLLLPRVKGRIWYWFPTLAQNPWYASMRSFIQAADGVWNEAVARAAETARKP